MDDSLKFRVNTHQLLVEITTSLPRNSGILEKPINIFRSLLAAVADRAAEIDDRELNKLMLRLGLYEVCNPESADYNPKFVKDYLKE